MTLTENFIYKAIKIHGIKYGYEEVVYVDRNTEVKILHEDHYYFQTPGNHLSGRGCNICYKDNKKFFMTELLNKLLELDLKYISGGNNSLIVQDSDSILYKTYAKRIFKNIKPSILSALDKNHCYSVKASKVHNFFYDYSCINYINTDSVLEIICPVHLNFQQKAGEHLQGKGCKLCAKERYGYSLTAFLKQCKNNQGLLYIIKCFNENEEFYKIGRTSKTVKKRFPSKNSMPYNYEILQEIVDTPKNIFNLEILLHRYYRKFKYSPKIPFKGHGECYEIFC